jgi:hypothetical protein
MLSCIGQGRVNRRGLLATAAEADPQLRYREAAMLTIRESTRAYEAWLREALPAPIDRGGLVKKHQAMRDGQFPFLRATYWRWAETILVDCPAIADLPEILSVGDLHVENFGTWRDAEGRLVWGINDYDEAARMPFVLDLVRLAASIHYAQPTEGLGIKRICKRLLKGYRAGLEAPAPLVLEREHRWLRKGLEPKGKARTDFWDKMDRLVARPVPRQFRQRLLAALPAPRRTVRMGPRRSGVGSLGRPRFVAIADWRGGTVIREAKALVPSAWNRAHRPNESSLAINAIAGGAHRAPDPHYHEADGILVRRRSPSNRKIEMETGLGEVLAPRLITLMGFETAACHAGDAARIKAVARHVARLDTDQMADRVVRAIARIEDDYIAFGGRPAEAGDQNRK